ncbi:hypothetical protein D046_7199C, partial [Vibrio parahaemolyticus V-223/04]
RRSCF